MTTNVNPAFNHESNTHKELLNLKGMLEGVSADSKLKEVEVVFLSNWIKDQTHIKKDGDLLDLQEAIEDVLEDGVVTNEEREDLLVLIGDILKYNSTQASSVDCLVNKFLGFLQGISCDNELTDSEISALSSLIESEQSTHDHWAIKRIKLLVDEILEDGVVDEQERAQLLGEVKAVCGQEFLDTGIASGLSTGVLVGEINYESLINVKVCFTGTLTTGTRAEMTKKAKASGIDVTKTVTQNLDILVIGGVASRDWKFSSFGRKVEKVHQNRDEKGSTTAIIDEPTWNQLFTKLG